MVQLTTRFKMAACAILLVAVATACLMNSQTAKKPSLMTPNLEWEPPFFKGINERVNESGLLSLRDVLLANDDLEVRVWVGFGLYGIDGFIIQRSSDHWSAIDLHEMSERPPHLKSKKSLPAPKSGWEAAWQKLVSAGILTLPDASAVQCRTYIKDGTSYVVEINMNQTYRTYLYDNPKYGKCEEAKQMIRIGEIIADEFGLEDFKIGDVSQQSLRR